MQTTFWQVLSAMERLRRLCPVMMCGLNLCPFALLFLGSSRRNVKYILMLVAGAENASCLGCLYLSVLFYNNKPEE